MIWVVCISNFLCMVVFVAYAAYRDWFNAKRQDYLNDKVIDTVESMLDRMMSQNWIDYVNGKKLLESGTVRYDEEVRRAAEEEARQADNPKPREVPPLLNQ